MIGILTETPDEVVNSLKSYFLIDGLYDILFDDYPSYEILEDWEELYADKSNEKDKIEFACPHLVITSNKSLIINLSNEFKMTFFCEIDDIMYASKTFIEAGFLPLDHELIRNYVKLFMNEGKNEGDSANDAANDENILQLFAKLGYIDSKTYAAETKLISSLLGNEETEKYGHILTIMNNNDTPTNNEKYKAFIYECLKYIDINIFVALGEK